ncbi:MAG: hypothetical protein QOE90_1691 [Thermoplasmata archaeon]|nr:hypothetical protein [Thermoplasmata archaeon]
MNPHRNPTFKSRKTLLVLVLRYRHETLGPGLHRFVFDSESRPGLTHELLVDLHDPGQGRLSCLCEASLYGKMCKHKRAVIQGVGRRGRRAPFRMRRPMR